MDILIPEIAVTEKIVRSLVVFGFLLVVFRVAGKCQLGQLTAFDLVVLLSISNVLQYTAIGTDNSLGGGLLGATVIMALIFPVAGLTFCHKRMGRLVANTPTVIVKHGQVIHANLDREHMSMTELRAALRKEGIAAMSEVRYANLEEDGPVSVTPRKPVPA